MPKREGQELTKEVAEAPEGGPKFLRNITFEEIRNKQNRLIGYKSSGNNVRKIIKFDNDGTNQFPVDGKSYTVRIVEDTKPEDPFDGEYIAEIVREDGDILHEEALKAKSSRLRSSPDFQALGELINGDVDISAEYRMMTARAEEFKELQVTEEERHRAFTGVFSGMLMSERGHQLVDMAMDRTFEADSEFLKGEIESGNNYTKEVVIGAGVHGAIWSLTRQMYIPEDPSLTLEQSDQVGGQFSEPGGALFRKNDRQRPERRDEPHLPGTRQSLTTFTEFATIQPSDIGGETYPHQHTTSDAARVNFFLSGRAVLDAKIEKIYKNPDSDLPGKYIVQFFDTKEEKVYEVRTDRVVFTSGLGEEVAKLKDEPATNKILAEEKEKFENGEDTQVMSFSQFCERAGDRSEAFPMKGIKKLILSGDGDSAVVVAGIALGYESQIGKTTTQLDSVEEITWIGPKWLTKEEFISKARARYHWVGLEFPREKFEGYYARIKPIKGARASELRRVDGKIKVICTSSEEKEGDSANEEAKPKSGKKTKELAFEGDHYVFAHGFKDVTDNVISGASNEVITEPSGIINRFGDMFRYPHGQVYYKTGNIRKLEITSYSEKEGATCRTVDVNGEVVEYKRKGGKSASEQLPKVLLDATNMSRLEIGYGEAIRSNLVLDTVNVDNKRPIAKQMRSIDEGVDLGIFKVGPASQLPLTSTEKVDSPVLAAMGENTAAIFRYAEYTSTFATMCAREDVAKDKNKVKPRNLTAAKAPVEKIKLKEIKKRETAVDRFNFSVDKPDRDNKLPIKLNTLDGLRLVIGAQLENCEFPEGLDSLSLTITRNEDGDFSSDEDQLQYDVESDPKLPLAYVQVLNRVFQDQSYGQFINKVTSLKGKNKPNPVIMNVRFRNGKVDPAAITYTISR